MLVTIAQILTCKSFAPDFTTLMMLEKIKHFFDRHIALTELNGDSEDKLKTASAALLIEMMHTEEAGANEKQQLILALLENSFSLTKEQADALMAYADHQRRQATDYFEFTHLICNAYTHDQKIQLIESMWKIAFVDNNLDMDEEYLVDKIARLLYITHAEVLQVKNRTRGY